ncbi:RloB family protein [Oceanisphaera psychrotolerans]|uniref:RloB family protein n=1 Tax=Oceanisphaera psychrotolerans TaxID=1414654 RepID=UPI000B0AFA0E|nr:RloB family protein [Oceanisphaera psychrotolerans]
MARNIRKSSSVSRGKGSSIKPKIKIIAYCEGKNTEPEFLKSFSLIHGNGLIKIECVGAAGVPVTIVNTCAEKIRELNKIAKKSNEPLDNDYQVWAVFDRDEHHNVEAAIEKARANNIKVAFSNPCFEIWPYLHFDNQTAPIHRLDMQKKLEGVLEGYDHKRSKTVCAKKIHETGNYEKAKRRAIDMIAQHEQVGIMKVDMNPSTNAHELLDLIIKNGRRKTSK